MFFNVEASGLLLASNIPGDVRGPQKTKTGHPGTLKRVYNRVNLAKNMVCRACSFLSKKLRTTVSSPDLHAENVRMAIYLRLAPMKIAQLTITGPRFNVFYRSLQKKKSHPIMATI